jgi:hypothetical protein
MTPREYYYNQFSADLQHWISRINDVHKHDRDEVFIPIQSLTPESLEFLEKEARINFRYSLAFTLLIDQVMHSYAADYRSFHQKTRYPKLEYGISNVVVEPWRLLRSFNTKLFTEYVQFFMLDLKRDIKSGVFGDESWERLRIAMLHDDDLLREPHGPIFRHVLEDIS